MQKASSRVDEKDLSAEIKKAIKRRARGEPKTIEDLVGSYFENKNCSIRKILQKPYFIRKNAMIDDIFKGFKRRRTHIALIRENNKILGMVTMEDVLEELVPDIGEPHFIKRRRA